MDHTVDVPSPVPPGDGDAWYAPAVKAQYAVDGTAVATVRETDGFTYRTRPPSLGNRDTDAVDRAVDRLAAGDVDPPLTREGLREWLAREGPLTAILTRQKLSPAARRRVRFHAAARRLGFGELTVAALDDRLHSVERHDRTITVHTTDFAPAKTPFEADTASLDRFTAERIAGYSVGFAGFEIPVTLYRVHALGGDPFAVRYAVREPHLLAGDRELIERCKERIWDGGATGPVENRIAFVRDRAERYLTRRLAAREVASPVAAAQRRLRRALAAWGLRPPTTKRAPTDRIDDLVYYVLRDLVGHGKLTVPIRDPNLEDVEANRVGERVKVVPRDELHDGRVPSNVTFDSESEFVNLVTRLAAEDGEELSASRPSAKVNLDVGTGETVRCAVALPTISEDGPHVSVRKQAADPMTPPDLVDRGAISTELVALLWLLYEHHGVVLFSGPTGVGKTTLMNAHMPFVPYDDRPISIDEGSREVRLPHETGVSLSTRDHESEYKRVAMADLMTEANYLNPDTEVIAEINTPASFETFAESLNTGHGLVGTTHAEDVHKLVNRVVEQGLPAYLLREIDLVVFPRQTDGERYVGEAIELLGEHEYESTTGAGGVIEKDERTVCWNRVAERTKTGMFTHAFGTGEAAVLDRIADRTDRPVAAVREEFDRKHRYVRYCREEDIDGFDDLFAFLADLQTDEAATVAGEVARREVAGDADD